MFSPVVIILPVKPVSGGRLKIKLMQQRLLGGYRWGSDCSDSGSNCSRSGSSQCLWCEYCAGANEVSIWGVEMVAGDVLPAGLTVAAVGKMSARELSELKALMAVEKQTGQKISAESLEKLMLDSGSKGNWSKELNNP